MNRDIYNRRLFFIGALWNWSAAIVFAVISIFLTSYLPLFLKIIPENMLWFHLFMGAVFVFGLGYYWISKDTYRNRDLIKMGIIGKTFVFCLLTYGWQTDVVTILVFLAGTVDLLFTFFFVEVLTKLNS